MLTGAASSPLGSIPAPVCRATEAKNPLRYIEYFHVVFTLPAELAALALQNRHQLYGLLFRAAATSLKEIAVDPRHLGARLGFLAVLHSWGSNLSYHPHLHCVVPGGGLAPDVRRWIACRPGFFLPVRVLSRRFRSVFLARYLSRKLCQA